MLLEEFPFEPGFRLIDGDQLNKVAAEPAYSVDNTVTATGTSQTTAYGIRATVTVVTAGGDNAGLRLPFPKVGRMIFVLNYTATGKRVYPFDTELINGVSFADMPFQMGMVLICTSAGSWAASLTETNTSGDVILVASDADTATGDGHFVEISGGAGGTTSGAGGPVSITGGQGTPDGSVTIAGSPVNVQGIVFLSAEGSIQEAIDALPATGGQVVLSANTTYMLTTTITTTKPNVTVTASGWSTILKRAPTMTSDSILRLIGSGCVIENLMADGSSVFHLGSELAVDGNDSMIRHCQVINGGGDMHIRLGGNNCSAINNTVIGQGINLGFESGCGIWASTQQTVYIEGNYIRGVNTAGITFDGDGSRCIGNTCLNCHLYMAQSGGVIGYYNNSVTPLTVGGVVANNTIKGGGPTSEGMEITSACIVSGNVIDGVAATGLHINFGGPLRQFRSVTGNIIRNVGSGYMGILVDANVTHFSITGNTIYDDRATPVMQRAIEIGPGCDFFTVSGNSLGPVTGVFSPLQDFSVTLNRSYGDNIGVDNVIGEVGFSAGTLTLPNNPMVILRGAATVTAIDTTANCWAGRQGKFIPLAAVVFTAGATIGNTVTTVANVPMAFMFDGTKLYLGA